MFCSLIFFLVLFFCFFWGGVVVAFLKIPIKAQHSEIIPLHPSSQGPGPLALYSNGSGIKLLDKI